MAGKTVLVLFAHPALEKSRVNRVLLEAVRDLPQVTLCDLYQRYPEHDIDVAAEQAQLRAHDVVVTQHPFFWYSAPALIKDWQDLVLQHGWAYGSGGNALRGKLALNALTTGGAEAGYRKGGVHDHSINDFLLPFAQTARLCGMRYLPPFVAHGSHAMDASEIARHAADYRRLLCALRDGQLDLAAAEAQARLNTDLASLLGADGGSAPQEEGP